MGAEDATFTALGIIVICCCVFASVYTFYRTYTLDLAWKQRNKLMRAWEEAGHPNEWMEFVVGWEMLEEHGRYLMRWKNPKDLYPNKLWRSAFPSDNSIL